MGFQPFIKPKTAAQPYHYYFSSNRCWYPNTAQWSRRLKLGFQPSYPVVILASGSPRSTDTERSSVGDGENANADSVYPVYVPTPADRELRTPHSGYHFDGTRRKFFEGWYFKVAIPERRQCFCFIYTVENPAFRKKLSALEMAEHGHRSTGVGVQILGAYDKYICHYSDESHNFWGSRHELMLGNTFVAVTGMRPPKNEVPPQEFNRRVLEGFQVTPLWNQGFIRDDCRSDYVETVKTARWEYDTRPIFGWGGVGSKQNSTAGWLAAFPVFEPHWQICMASGLSTGWIEWEGERFEFKDAPSYSEKNWGGAFPRKWFWLQCNDFKDASGEVSLTAAGGLRQLPGRTENFENAALLLSCGDFYTIGIHSDGIFYEFVPWNGVLNWEISPWGYWHVAAENGTHLVELEATAKDAGLPVLAPTAEAGLSPACKDTFFGILKLQMWGKTSDGAKGKEILNLTSSMATVEVGGGPWFNTWKCKTTMPELLKRALNVPIDVDRIFGFVPLFKPPGL